MISPKIIKGHRELFPGMGTAVAARTVLRKMTVDRSRYLTTEEAQSGESFSWESWGHVASRVSHGSALLHPVEEERQVEYDRLNKHLAKATTLMSGRHLQHGDENQPTRPGEVVTNCSTSTTSFMEYYLLLNGSGVGRSYDDALMVVDWDNLPMVECVLSEKHADYNAFTDTTPTQAIAKYGENWNAFDDEGNYVPNPHRNVNLFHFTVPDSREGWAKAIEILEVMAYRGVYSNRRIILDFSNVRCKGSPIGGMQDRPASGPKPMIEALRKVMSIKGAGMPRWKQTMYIDHYLAECVLVGGARRAARIATKSWTDPGAIEFCRVKESGDLWSSNNSLAVTKDFWKQDSPYSRKLFREAISTAYKKKSGEPGFVNIDLLTKNERGREEFLDNITIGSGRYTISEIAKSMVHQTFTNSSIYVYPMIVNPCGEIALWVGGAYCVIADVVPYHADTLDEAEDAFRVSARALIRANRMDFVYKDEVARTNRIGVGMTGIHEFAWKFFKTGFRDFIKMDTPELDDLLPALKKNVVDFWHTLARFSAAVRDEAHTYAKELKMVVPHTSLTTKPAGTTSKLFGLTEGAHLPTMREYLRWVQFTNSDPLVEVYRSKGYPIRQLVGAYKGMTIVGFPTSPAICELGMGDALVTAPEATPEEQYQYLRLLEKYYIHGIDQNGKRLTPAKTKGNQVSYTLKYYTDSITEEDLRELILKNQPTVACCSIMPAEETDTYEYLPEEPITKLAYFEMVKAIDRQEIEDIGSEHVECSGGACPVDFSKSKIVETPAV